ncbi:MAG: LysR family transcriptional regulator [Lachnospiraceae bacterium]|nr:LysR family transcriptional regulator [Lachnospiraceae bacterium]
MRGVRSREDISGSDRESVQGGNVMDLKEQKYVCMLAECGNLTRAAEKLFISQPALICYLSYLEKNFGVLVFDRSGKRFVLTYAGERYVEKAKQMLQLEWEFNEELLVLAREETGRIRLGVPLRRGSWLIPPVIAEYEERCPGVEVIIREGNITQLNELLRNHELDMVILNRRDTADGMDLFPLFEEEFLAVVPVRHPVNEGAVYVPGERYRKISPEALDGQTLILHSEWQSSRAVEDGILKRHHITPSRIRTIRSIETSVQMAAEGLGIAFAREGYVVNMKYKKPVNYYILDMEQHKREVVVAMKEGTHLSAYMQEMLDILTEHGRVFLEG